VVINHKHRVAEHQRSQITRLLSCEGLDKFFVGARVRA
jgi:hypothetical protein